MVSASDPGGGKCLVVYLNTPQPKKDDAEEGEEPKPIQQKFYIASSAGAQPGVGWEKQEICLMNDQNCTPENLLNSTIDFEVTDHRTQNKLGDHKGIKLIELVQGRVKRIDVQLSGKGKSNKPTNPLDMSMKPSGFNVSL